MLFRGFCTTISEDVPDDDGGSVAEAKNGYRTTAASPAVSDPVVVQLGRQADGRQQEHDILLNGLLPNDTQRGKSVVHVHEFSFRCLIPSAH